MNLYFVYGPPGSGKSTIGRLLADDLGLPFWDLDGEIENRCGIQIPQIFENEGEAGFRAREKATLEKVLAGESGVEYNGVIALGGGALLDGECRARVEHAGPVVCLSAPVEILVERLQAVGAHGVGAHGMRPLLAGDLRSRLGALMEQRASHYSSFPLQVDTSLSAPHESAVPAVPSRTGGAAWQAQVLLGAFRVRGMGDGYDVRIIPGGLSRCGEAFQQRRLRGPLALVSDENVAGLYAEKVMESLRRSGYSVQLIVIPAGEAFKTVSTLTNLWEEFVKINLERGSTIVALGGGVVSDLVGFAAATFLRGVNWVVMPTSLLAMVDASLGGKTGADLPHGKNLVGAFHPPRLVLADPQTLSTLPEVELRSGLAEVIKHGIIGDPCLFHLVGAHGMHPLSEVQTPKWAEIVRRAIAVKVRVIQEDPYEKGFRAALNLGHTLGHAVEAASAYQVRHGEAVSIGMVCASRLSEKMGVAERGLTETITNMLRQVGLPVEIPIGLDRQEILRRTTMDKKRTDGKVRFVLPVRIGEVRVGVWIDNLELLLPAPRAGESC